MRRPTHRSRGSAPLVRTAAPPGRDPVVDDLEVLLAEALRLGEVLREPLRDRDVHVRERADRAIGETEQAPFAELVEPVLRRQPNGMRASEPGELPVDVGVDEVRVQDPRSRFRQGATTSPNAIGSTSALRRMSSSGTPRARELLGELPGARLVLVEHEEAHVPAARTQVGEELEEVRLRARDAGDLLRVEDDAVDQGRPAASMMPRAHVCTE